MSGRYTARAVVVAAPDGAGRTVLTRLRSDGPLALREGRPWHEGGGDAERRPAVVYLVGAAAGPLGGDDLALRITVAPGAHLAVRSVATTLALPGDGESRLAIRAAVGAGGRLDFAPEPTVAAAGCHHTCVAGIELGAGAGLRWREELVLGRHGERPGRYASRCDVTLDGRPLLRHELRVDDAGTYGSRAVLADAAAVGTVVLAGPGLTERPYADDDGLAVLPLAGPGVLVSATAATATALRRRLERGTAHAAP
ncbi:MAG TPA: urease accessory protein UreD [Streptosporangiaceae bacterium]|nr:urease accessory protein UreD [Streptosporangiaceae bacterium]